MPPNNESTITAPLPEQELRQLIHEVYILNIYVFDFFFCLKFQHFLFFTGLWR